MKALSLLLFLMILLNSCSIVKRNGYYQTKNYRTNHLNLFDKSESNRKKSEERSEPSENGQMETKSLLALTKEITYDDVTPSTSFKEISNTKDSALLPWTQNLVHPTYAFHNNAVDGDSTLSTEKARLSPLIIKGT